MARISPVRGSSATAAPDRPSKAFSIAACSDASIAEGEAGPVLRRLALRLRDLEAAAVHDDAAEAVLAHHRAVVLRLDAGLAHERARGEALVLRELQLPLRDLAHPAERVRGGRGERIRAQGHHLHADLRQLQPPRLERGDVREGRVGLHHHGAVGLAADEPLADRRLSHVERRAEPGDQPVEVLGELGDEHDVERGTVAHEDLALAVEQGAARRGEGHQARAVVLRQAAEVARADHLQVPELDDESGDEHHRQGLQDREAGLDDPQVLVDPHRPPPLAALMPTAAAAGPPGRRGARRRGR